MINCYRFNNFQFRLSTIITILWGLFCLHPVQSASAHPADMYSHEQLVAISTNAVDIDWKITPGPFLADSTWNDADLNQDGMITPDEASRWVNANLPNWQIELDGQNLGTAEIKNVIWPKTLTDLESGSKPIDISFALKLPGNLTGKHAIEIHNAFQEDVSLNWFALKSDSGLTFSTPVQNNGQIQFNLTFPGSGSRTALEMTSWNSGIPNPTELNGALTNLATNLANPGANSKPGNSLANPTAALTGLVETQSTTPWFFIGAFLLSLALGCLHALTPGHGKTLVAAYLVGSNGRPRDAIFLGAVVTITHTGSVLLLGLITLVASRYILPTLIIPVLEIVSGVSVVGFGLYLLIRRSSALLTWYRTRRDQKKVVQITSINQRVKRLAFSPIKVKSHVHADGSIHSPEHLFQAHTHEVGIPHGHSHTLLPENQITWKSLLTLGISGGLVPCPDAIAILLVAVAVNRIPLGMLLIIAFSIGLALILIGIGLAMVNGVRLVKHSQFLDRFSVYTPAISALVVLGLGIGLTFTAVKSVFASSTTRSAAQTSKTPIASSVNGSLPGLTFDLKRAKILYEALDQNQNYQLFSYALSGGSSIQFTSEPSGVLEFSLSPDGKTILYTSANQAGGDSFWSMAIDGTHKHIFLDCQQSDCQDPTWFPNEQKLIYERHDNSQNSAQLVYSLWWLDLKSGETKPVFQDQSFPSSFARFSHDGQWLSYITPANNTLQVFNLVDQDSFSIPYRSGMPEIWSPTDETFLYWDIAPQTVPNLTNFNLKRYNIGTSQPNNLSSSLDQGDTLAAWSSDGKWIAIARSNTNSDDATNQEKVWLVKPDGTEAHVLFDLQGAFCDDLSWSPDSQYLLYTRFTDAGSKGTTEIRIVDAHNGNETKTLSGGSQPIFLP